MLQIDWMDEVSGVKEELQAQIEQLLQFAAKEEGIDTPCEMSVTFVSDERIHELNLEFRGIDRPTDVLSFAMEEYGEDEMEIVFDDMEEEERVLGDIVVSVSKAVEQAENYGHSFERELAFLCLHGFLHLLGYDHMNEDDEKEMFGRQDEILTKFGITRD